jgi:hypothetical protein
MASTPVNWNPNRYGSVKHVLKFDAATGTYSLQEQNQSYNGTNYNFASLPTANNTTTSTTTAANTTTQTTQQQTAEAFGDVKPHYWDVEDKDDKSGANVFQWNEKSAQTEEDTTAKEYSDFSTDSNLIERFGTFEEYQKSLHPFKSRIKSVTAPFTKQAKKTWDWAKPLALRAIDAITKRPTISGDSANQSFRGVGGLYSKEINLMNQYGSTVPTPGNPTGDTRKDDAGFNIVSFAGNYNMIGTYSRRHNMLAKADIYEKGSNEWKTARNKIRDDWEEEKKTGVINIDYDIDPSGSKPDRLTGQVKVAKKKRDIQQYTSGNGGNNKGNAGGAQLGSGMSTGQHAAFRN